MAATGTAPEQGGPETLILMESLTVERADVPFIKVLNMKEVCINYLNLELSNPFFIEKAETQ